MFELTPSLWETVLYGLGWACGWWLLARPRLLPVQTHRQRPPVAVVIPARNEAAVIATLVGALAAQRREGDEIVVVDDASTDGTGDAARQAGASVIRVDVLPHGWAGKPHACHLGATATSAPVLIFLDADITPRPTTLDDVAAEVAGHPDALITVQPWHVTGSAVEQLSAPFNLLTIMGTGGFADPRPRWLATRPLAFGPVMALTRQRYDLAGGHAHARVRSAVAEDLALARRVGRTRLYLGGSMGIRYRMYPDGWRPLIEGWTKNLATGAGRAPWWALVAAGAWVTSLAGGWLASPWWYITSALQFAVLGRRVGAFRWWAAVAYPLLIAVVVTVFVRSTALTLTGRAVSWKGRRLPSRVQRPE